MLKKQILVLFLILWTQQSSCLVEDLLKLAQYAGQFIVSINKIKSNTDPDLDVITIITRTNGEVNRQIIQRLKHIDEKIDDLKSYTRTKLNNLEFLLNGLPDQNEIRDRKWELSEFMAKTDEKWSFFVKYIEKESPKEAYDSLTTDVLASIGKDLAKFRNQITPLSVIKVLDAGFWGLLAKSGHNQTHTLCNEGETYHHIIVRLYQTIMMTELKAHILLCFAYRFQLSNRDAWKAPVEVLEENFRKQFTAYIHELTKSLTNPVRPYIRSCDPSSWRSGEDFLEFDGFLQQTMYKQVGVYKTDAPSCPSVVDPSAWTYIAPLQEHSTCHGNVSDCANMFEHFKNAEFCLWNEGQYKVRYFTRNGVTQGTDIENTCPEGDKYTEVGSPSFKDPFGWADHYCSCRCTTIKWQLVTQLMPSRMKDNYVIVGMRFNRILHYIYIQIAEGKLEANGYISDFRWVKPIRKLLGKSPYQGFVSLDMSRRAFFFDDLELPPGYTLTGVQLISTTRHEINGFAVGIYGVKFDYETGELDLTQESFVEFSNKNAKKELEYVAKKSTAMNGYESHIPDSDEYTHLYIRQSSFGDDYGQSTLPFLDSVPIVTNPLSPIGGVGLFHKGYKDHAGFLSLRLYPIDYVHFMKTFVDAHNVTALLTWAE